MTPKQLRELNDWIAENVMSFVKCGMGWQEWCPNGKDKKGRAKERLLFIRCFEAWQPTTDPAAAMEVLKKCHEKVAFGITTQAIPSGWNVRTAANTSVSADAATLELAICQFAKKLFSKYSAVAFFRGIKRAEHRNRA